ncbi:hypothetical protein ACIQF6_36070 [Kitasatospora sp. NPDC092948]|uniref:hypothetical protein n=1 Tax=Kitasatospora sp. NPDC092948 TaxID=3364088 RepID=UPI003826089A
MGDPPDPRPKIPEPELTEPGKRSGPGPPIAAQPLYTALDHSGLHALTDDDHPAVRDLTRHLDPATLRQVAGRLERTRTAAFALRGTAQTPPVRPVGRRGQF